MRVADDGALEVRGPQVVAGARGAMEGMAFRSCPVAMTRHPETLDALRTHRGRTEGYTSSAPRSPRVERLVDLVGREVAALTAWQIERLDPEGARG